MKCIGFKPYQKRLGKLQYASEVMIAMQTHFTLLNKVLALTSSTLLVPIFLTDKCFERVQSKEVKRGGHYAIIVRYKNVRLLFKILLR